jgi:type II restriction/modification system DNA methylase subunit YeeA
MASNRNALKKYAPQARLDFIQAMINRAAQFGITKSTITQGVVQGDLYILNGKAFPRAVAEQRDRLTSRIARDGFDQVMEAIAYTWFNRFLAIRYMEIHDYFDHGFRVLSHPEGHDEPQILEQIAKVDLPGLKREEIVSLKIDGTKDEQIYRKILIAQCNDLHRAMPFLFERIDDETELLLPENLLQSDSIARKLVNEVDEVEWQEIEIIGWLYQYYISDKKDEVIGKVVKSEDIPAATQLFTPNWIVKYMVHNSLGAQWMETYPNSTLRGEMEYYIAPSEQTPEVQAQLEAITPKELDPESITLIDPAVGSGHILVEAYNLFRTIYLERGYTRKEAARAILTKNLFGLDIDTRAAQMAGFALLMKARADDRSLLRDPPRINVLAIKDSREMDADALTSTLVPDERFEIVPSGDLLPDTLPQPTLTARRSNSKEGAAIRALIAMFDGADTFGSLITVPQSILDSLDMIEALLAKPISSDLLRRHAQLDARDKITPLVNQARLLGSHYDCVVANPPYIGVKGMNPKLKKYLQDNFTDVKSDVFAAFIIRDTLFAKPKGRLGFMSPFVWMFISSYEKLRAYLLDKKTITSLVQLEYSGFDGATVPICTFTLSNSHNADFKGSYVRLSDFRGSENQAPKTLEAIADQSCGWFFRASASDFEKIPGSPIAYWLSKAAFTVFEDGVSLSEIAEPRLGLATTDNKKYLRLWFELSHKSLTLDCKSREEARESGRKWFPYNKGGEFRRWYGNNEYFVNWQFDGREIKSDVLRKYPYLNGNPGFVTKNQDFYFRAGITWTYINSAFLGMRYSPSGFIFDVAGSSVFPSHDLHFPLLGYLCSKVAKEFIDVLNPTMNIQAGNVGKLPIIPAALHAVDQDAVESLVRFSKIDWDSFETSWEFAKNPLLSIGQQAQGLEAAYIGLRALWRNQTEEMQSLEEKNNSVFINAYGLQGELTPYVPISEVTLSCNPHYRYGGNLTDIAREERLKSDTMCELISYAIGCIMGRYSLSEPGLIYAHSGGVDFDPGRYGTFPADEDGIIPITEDPWFEDDAATRIEEFIGLAWPEAPVMETLGMLTDGLAMSKGGEPREALRGYLSKQFFKDHLQTYKNRPIYWLFSSGKQKAFEALVYLHRYNEGTLARMRTNYVTPLMGKLQQRISDLEAEVASSASSAEKARKTKEKDKYGKQLVELRRFDEELRHLADQRIAIDLDDGVRVNYAKFGNLLSGVDKICGKDKDD